MGSTAILAFLIGGCLVFIAAIAWALRPRRDPPPEATEHGPVRTRVVGTYIVTDTTEGN